MEHVTEEDLVLLYYGEPGVSAAARGHVRECPGCAAAAKSLALTLNACNEWQIPEPEPELSRSVWAQLAPRLESKPVRHGLPIRWLVPAFCALLLVAFLTGRFTGRPQPVMMAGLSDQARQRILAITVADHLDRVEMLLTELSNATSAAEFSSTRGRAQDLVQEGQLVLQTVSLNPGETATATMLDEMERFLLEVANAPEPASPEQRQALQRRLQSGSLLFKVRIIETNLRTKVQQS